LETVVGRPAFFVAVAATGFALCAAALSVYLYPLIRNSDSVFGFLILTAGAGIGLVMGSLAGLTVVRSELADFSGLAAAHVTSVKALVLGDSHATGKKGSFACRVGLLAVSGADVQADAGGRALLITGETRRCTAGEILSVRGRLELVDGRGDWSFLLLAREIRSRGFDSRVFRFRGQVRDHLRGITEQLGQPAGALAMALLMGERGSLPPDLQETFRDTGTLHLLALSGLHLAVIFVPLLLVLRPVGARWRWLILSIVAVSYLFIAGPRPSLVRAAIAVFVVGLARLLDRDRRPMNVIALVLIVHLMVDPIQCRTLAFRLSYLSLAGLVIGLEVGGSRLSRWLPPALAGPLAASLGAQVATLPLVAARFGIWHPVSIVANLIGAPLVSLYIWSSLVLVPLAMMSRRAAAFASLWLNGLVDLLLKGGRLLASAPSMRIGPGAALAVTSGVALWLYLGRERVNP
jgi:ComEC/Rec2-related protein